MKTTKLIYRVINEEVQKRIKENRTFLDTIQNRKIMGNIMRRRILTTVLKKQRRKKGEKEERN